MVLKKFTAIMMLFLIVLTAPAVSFAGGMDTKNEDSGLNTFLSVINAWGTFLARITGSYDSLDHISKFSDMARAWHDFTESDGFSPTGFLRMIFAIFGISLFSEPYTPGGGSDGSYTL